MNGEKIDKIVNQIKTRLEENKMEKYALKTKYLKIRIYMQDKISKLSLCTVSYSAIFMTKTKQIWKCYESSAPILTKHKKNVSFDITR